MALKRYLKFGLIVLLIAGFGLRTSGIVNAETNCIASGQTVESISGFNLYTVQCRLAKLAGQLQIQILDRGNELNTRRYPLGTAISSLDPHNQVWIFNYGGVSTPALVIDFHQQTNGNGLIADLYDHQGAYPDLAYLFTSTGFEFQKPQTPTVEVSAPDGWWYNGKINNFNLDISIDGRVTSEFDIQRYFDYFNIKKDGKPDFTIRIRDSNKDGRPDDDWRTANISPHPGLPRLPTAATNLVVNTARNETLLTPTLPWAYLGMVTYGYDTTSNASTGQPPIQVDWTTGLIEYVGEFVSSRADENQYFVYSYYPLQPDITNQPNFEAPFAWYDLADDHDKQAELAIRVQSYPAQDRYFLDGQYRKPIVNVRYSWDQDNDGFWDYKLGLLSSNITHNVVSLPELNLKLNIPAYSDLPRWVTQQNWGVVTFVAAEDVKQTGEGIYEWDVPTYMADVYFTGLQDQPLPILADGSSDLSQLKFDPSANPGHIITPGMRGEYQFDLNRQPTVYISSIDGKLHLRYAAASYWDTGVDNGSVRGSDMNDDGYQDMWQYYQNQTLVEELVYSPYSLVYQNTHNVSIDLTAIPSHYLETTPPANHDQWVTLGAALSQYDSLHLVPGQFSQRLAVSPGPTVNIQNAEASDFRLAGESLRFVLNLASDFKTSSDVSAIGNLSAGKYLVITNSNGVNVTPLIPANVSIVGDKIDAAPAPEALHPTQLGIDLTNSGNQDAHDVHISWLATHDGQTTSFDKTTLDVLAGQQVHTETDWTPLQAGDWQVQVQVGNNVPQPVTLQTQFTVESASVSAEDLLGLDGQLPVGGVLVIIFAVCLIVSAPFVYWLIFRDDS